MAEFIVGVLPTVADVASDWCVVADLPLVIELSFFVEALDLVFMVFVISDCLTVLPEKVTAELEVLATSSFSLDVWTAVTYDSVIFVDIDFVDSSLGSDKILGSAVAVAKLFPVVADFTSAGLLAEDLLLANDMS